jgi:hypothetical protein
VSGVACMLCTSAPSSTALALPRSRFIMLLCI